MNPETQRPNICTATGKRGCKYAVDGQEPQHYATKQEAQVAIAAQAKAENSTFTTVSKGKERSGSRRGGVERFKDDFSRRVASMSEDQAVENISSMHAEYTAMVEAGATWRITFSPTTLSPEVKTSTAIFAMGIVTTMIGIIYCERGLWMIAAGDT